MKRVIGMDIHRTFAEVVFWEGGQLRQHGRVDMTRSGLEGFGRALIKEDEVVVEATGNAMAVVRVLSPFVARVIIANPLQVKAIAHAHVKTDKIDAGVLAKLHAAGYLPEGWTPDAGDYQEFRVWAGMMGAKEPRHATTQRAQDTRCPARSVVGRSRSKDGVRVVSRGW